jgi:hypothetical protein
MRLGVVTRRVRRARRRPAERRQCEAEVHNPYSVHEKEKANVASLRSGQTYADRSMMQQAADRMSPVHAPVVVVVQRLAVFLPEFVRKQKRDDEKRHDEKCAQDQMLDHSDLLIDGTTTISL